MEDQPLEPVGYFLGNPADDRAAEAVTDQDNVVQIPFPKKSVTDRT